MPYVDQTGMEERFGEEQLRQLTDKQGAGVIDGGLLQQALDDAAGEIGSYLKGRYSLPLDAALIAGSKLPQANADIARYNLMGDVVTDAAAARYKAHIAWLRDVAAGRASLGEQDTATASNGRVVTGQGVSGHNWDTY